MLSPLQQDFFARPTLLVARELLGKLLVRHLQDGQRLVGRIVETEAYGVDDPGAHGWRDGRGVLPIGRSAGLFAPPGRGYVYFTYGTHWMLNVTTDAEDVPGGVLIRGIEPLKGLDFMYSQRPKARRERDLTNGPGKIAAAFAVIGPEFFGKDLTRPPLYFSDDPSDQEPFEIETSSRIGLSKGIEAHWRFFIKDNPFVSPGLPSDIAHARKKQRGSHRL